MGACGNRIGMWNAFHVWLRKPHRPMETFPAPAAGSTLTRGNVSMPLCGNRSYTWKAFHGCLQEPHRYMERVPRCFAETATTHGKLATPSVGTGCRAVTFSQPVETFRRCRLPAERVGDGCPREYRPAPYCDPNSFSSLIAVSTSISPVPGFTRALLIS
jgi:hypothetical protein